MTHRLSSLLRRIWNAAAWIFRAIARLVSALILLSFLASLVLLIWLFRDASRPPEVLPGTVLVMDVNGLIVDAPPVDAATQRLLGERVQTVQELIRTLRTAAVDDRIAALLLKPGAYSLNFTSTLDLHAELRAFQEAGKPIFAYTETLGMGNYLLVSGADRIVMPPSGSTFVKGLRAEVAFYRGLFEKLGVTPEFVAIGAYKIAPQVYTMDHMSEEFQETLNEQLDAYYAAYVRQVAEARGTSVLQVQQWIDDGLYTARDALQAGMIDELAYETQLEDRIAEALSRAARDPVEEQLPDDQDAPERERTPDEDEVTATESEPAAPDATAAVLTTVTASAYSLVEFDDPERQNAANLHRSGDTIAVVYASGTIVTGLSAPSPTQPSIGSDSLRELLDELADDDEIRGIILRIDSGGGGAMAADIIRHSVQEATKKKPVVVSMADVAASGGYMIAIPADRIVAHPLTLTGSIGIFGGKFSLEGLSEKVGIRIESLQRGRNAGLLTLSRAHSPEEHERFRQFLQQRYDEFVANVAIGRAMSDATAHEAAQGRVWTGTQALELGLVDAVGNLDTALGQMKDLLDIPEQEDVHLVLYPRAGNPLAILRQRIGGWLHASARNELQTLHAHLETLARLQHEQVFAWWPARIRLD